MATSPVKEVTGEEIAPGAHLQSDDELLDWVRNNAAGRRGRAGTARRRPRERAPLQAVRPPSRNSSPAACREERGSTERS
jgi:hypothetical protein